MEISSLPSLHVLHGQPEHLSTSYQTAQLMCAAGAYFSVTEQHFADKNTGRYVLQARRLWSNLIQPVFHRKESDYLFYGNDGFADLRRWDNHRIVYWMDTPWDYAATPPTVRQWKDWLRYENVRCAEDVFAVSAIQVATARKLRPGREASVHYLPVGVDCLHYSPENGAVENVRALYALTDAVVIGYLGYLGMVGGRMAAEILVEAAPGIIRNGHVHFLIVGFGPALEPLKQLVAARGMASSFTFTGYIPPSRLPSFLAAMDICIDTLEPGFHSEARSETKLKQYMALGRACVATAIGENCVDLEQGAAGCLVAPGAEALRDGILSLIDDPDRRKRLGDAARQRALTVYDWTVLAKQLANALGVAGQSH